MKMMKLKIALISILLTLLANVALAEVIANSKHNLAFRDGSSTYYYETDEAQICVFCHTPHGGSLSGPLWNRDPATSSFTMYSSNYAFKNEVNSVVSVNAESMLCLSCHDGSVGVNNLLNFGSSGAQPNVITNPFVDVEIQGSPGANPRIGALTVTDNGTGSGHLEDDHPISLNYQNAFNDNSTGLHTLGDAKLAGIKFFPPNGAADRLECSSCHNVHDNANPPFLIKDNAGSALCLSCHVK